MSGDQAGKLKELERNYEHVIDANCAVFSRYFREVLESGDGGKAVNPPPVVVEKRGRVDAMEEEEQEEEEEITEDRTVESEEIGFHHGRYNPIWAEGDRSVEYYSIGGSSSSNPPSYPQRVSATSLATVVTLKIQKRPPPAIRSMPFPPPPPTSTSDSEASSSLSEQDGSAAGSSSEPEERNRSMALFEPRKDHPQQQRQSIPAEPSCTPGRLMEEFEKPPGGGQHTPPKDFVCPITSNLFDDPVTLETGQTYERRAIQEWLDRGNLTCPITRQKLQSTQLPKTNYVLKRLIVSWQEQNPSAVLDKSLNYSPEITPIAKPMMHSTSPNSVICQASLDGTVSELRRNINKLCMSEILEESEMAVLRIKQFWQEASLQIKIVNMLSKPPVINGFVEILFNSVDTRVLRATVLLLCELGSREKSVVHTLTQVDSDVDGIVALLKKGLLEAIVLIYLLRPSVISLIEMDIIDSLLAVIKKSPDELMSMCLKPRTAAVLLLRQILGGCQENMAAAMTSRVVSAGIIDSIIGSLEAEWSEERMAAVAVLSKCMQEDGKCRNMIADKAELAPVLESFIGAADAERFEIIRFLSELVRLNRRTFNEQVLHIIKDEGGFSTMHTFLNYLQTALQDQCPVIAGLLLQLDLLAEPRKMSIYREEAIDTLISCLKNTDFPAAQLAAAETIMSLQGRFSVSGKPLTRAFLLKHAGLEKRYRTVMRMEHLGNSNVEFEESRREEEKAADDWERRVAYALVSHEFGLVFEALAEGLKSRDADLRSSCFVSAAWLAHMLGILPDTGIRGAARVCLLKLFLQIFKSTKDVEDKALSMLALNSFIQDAEGLRDLAPSMKDVLKGLRELKKHSPFAFEMLKVLSEGSESSADLWNHKDLVQVDCSHNGEVLSIVCYKDIIFSGHSDGTIKVWTGRGSILHQVQEVREHTKAVTSLVVSQSGEELYSGSLDKTAKVWSIGDDALHCAQVHDMRDQVHNLVVANSIACFIPQGAGVKVHSWNGGSKLLNPNKHIKCLSLVQGKLYCGCHDSSIQEIDLTSGTLNTIQSGSRKLLSKGNPIHALQLHSGLIYSASSSLDGAAVKIWNASNYELVGTLPSTADVRAIAVSSDLVYLGCKGGMVEVWCKEKHQRVDTLQSGTNAKIHCMALNGDEEFLAIGTSDGRIQAWGLS
ncbi:RING-type E3 ubiquitin transferase [Psidium guajava]|nr:RING-type E3 ubiquitin transferase [Psidium guajava]